MPASSTAGAAPARRVGVRPVLLLGGLAAIGPLGIDAYLPAFPQIGDDLGGGTAGVQLTMSAYFAGTMVGLVFAGPLSDRFGRKRPMIVGLAVFMLGAVACALSPSIAVLAVSRFVQGMGAATGSALQVAVVRDLTSGAAAARLMSAIVTIMIAAPVVAPVLGSQLLVVASWEWIFVAMAVYSGLWLLMIAFGFRETLPPERRHGGRLHATLRAYRGLRSDRGFMALALGMALANMGFYAYLTTSSPVLQGPYELSPTQYGLTFAAIAVAIAFAAQLNRRLLLRSAPRTVMLGGLGVATIAAIVMLVGVALAPDSLAAFLVPLCVTIAAWALIQPNVYALALHDHAGGAGSAASLLALTQAAFAVVIAPLAGIGSDSSGVPLAAIIAVSMTAALVVLARASRGSTIGPASRGGAELAPVAEEPSPVIGEAVSHRM